MRRAKGEESLAHAYEIAGEYAGNLTVRQLYYQLVARGYIPNSQESYKRLVALLTEARLAGDFPVEWLIDRTRESRPGRCTGDQTVVSSALENAARDLRQAPESWLWRDRWFGQSTHVSVWVEKEALAGVFETPCEELGVAWFVLRGYSSISALSQWVDHLSEACAESDISKAVVLYFGDHDGWEIPRSAERNVHAIAEVRDIYIPDLDFQRIALVREQIERYNPPPFPAKESSSRFSSYVAEHGLSDAWELDALRPDILDRLIRDSVAEHFDEEIYRKNNALVRGLRAEMRDRMRKPAWVREALEIEE